MNNHRGESQAPGDGPLLQVTGLSAGYGKLRVIHDVDFSVMQGEALGIIGRNGMGKTTLMKTIMGLLPIRQGAVTFKGKDLTHAAASQRCPLGIGYVPQGRLIFPRLTVEDNLATGVVATNHAFSRRLKQVLDVFPVLSGLLRRRGGSLSGGQQQILSIGRALMSDPKMLILDEPTEGIQPSIITEIGQSLRYLSRDTGVSVLVVEQRLDFLQLVAQDALIMDRGLIMARTSCETLVNDLELQHQYLGV